jgi:oligoendopeptidase F
MSKKMIAERADVADEHQWGLTALLETDKDWEQLFLNVEKEIEHYTDYRGRLKETVRLFKEAIEFHLSLSRRIERLYTYAHLKSDEDKSNQFYLGLHQRALNLYTRASEMASFMTPEIQSLPDEVINRYLTDTSLSEYQFYLEKILRYKPHTRNESEEQILAMSRELAGAPSQVFGQLDNVDLKFGIVTDESGNEIELSHGNFTTFLIDPSQDIRKKVFIQYYRAYQDHKHTLAATLAHSIKKDLFYSRARNFESCRVSAIFADNIPEAVYDNLISTVKANIEPLFKYLGFRQSVLGLELLSGWVDRYENRGKRSGAYSSGSYDSPPYILLNYEENNINSLYTLIHETGHSMHSYFSKKHQPYVDHDYTIFVAEVASTFNEDLLSRYLLELYKDDPKMKAYILNREIDNIRATLFRQTMFAEFEKATHIRAEANEPLTLDVMTDIYHQLLQTYFGNTLVLDPELSLECLRIPHFYSAFYVYKYATGVSAAIALADKVVHEGNPARQAYLDFLKLGGSKFPLDELLEAGVDMGSPEPIKLAIEHFEQLVDQLVEVHKGL